MRIELIDTREDNWVITDKTLANTIPVSKAVSVSFLNRGTADVLVNDERPLLASPAGVQPTALTDNRDFPYLVSGIYKIRKNGAGTVDILITIIYPITKC